jgi:hypothetical protein
MEQVEQAPCWRDRVRAARQLRHYDWQCHPAAAISLVTAMVLDENDDVREAAAQTLARMHPCLPEVHIALTRVAQTDPDPGTRRWANKGLKAIGRRCQGTCSACDAVVMRPALPVPVPALPPAYVPPVPAPPPAAEDIPLPTEPGRSPFQTPTARRDATTPGLPRLAESRPEPAARGSLLGRLLRVNLVR